MINEKMHKKIENDSTNTTNSENSTMPTSPKICKFPDAPTADFYASFGKQVAELLHSLKLASEKTFSHSALAALGKSVFELYVEMPAINTHPDEASHKIHHWNEL